MYILGISGGVRGGNQDGSATLMKDSEVVASVEEERLLRIKHAPGKLPEKAMRFVLNYGNITMEDVDLLVFPGETYKNFKEILGKYIISKFGWCPEIELVNHHDAHCASAYYASGFDEAMIVSADLSGDSVCTEFCRGSGQDMEVLRRIPKPNSLGIFYSVLTQYVGFQRDNDEYKVMGLSSYGTRGAFDFDWFLKYGGGAYDLNTDYIRIPPPGQPNPSKQEPFYNQKLVDKMGAPRLPEGEVTAHYEDIAACGQEHLEKVFVEMVTQLHKDTGLRKLCLAGGVALNCVVNQRLMNLDFIDDLYIQPAASDAGLSLGAAYMMARREGFTLKALPDVFMGPEYTNDELQQSLDMAGVKYSEEKDVASVAAQKVSEDKIVGWYHGRMEFGPRALGNRTILANPQNPDMKDIVNNKIKFREQFRPFAPSVLEEDSPLYFVGKSKAAPYMTITFDVTEGAKDVIPSVVHVDDTSRIQTVNKEQNAIYYEYLQELKKVTGHGVTLNTSFNVKGDPIVNTPYQALATFYGSGMDVLILGNYILEK
ncbi:MAG: carbamoyl transferase [Thermoplasmata archaeon]|nr:MAG: carbamoyl transferase [Thermoplasmata archaeon]